MASSADRAPDVLGMMIRLAGKWVNIDWVGVLKSMRRNATVTHSDPDSRMASVMTCGDENLPVPTHNRDVVERGPMHNGVSHHGGLTVVASVAAGECGMA